MELLNRELKLEKELHKKAEDKLQQSRKENKSPASLTPQAKRKKSLVHEVSDLFNETPEFSLNESNISTGNLNMAIKNESIEDSFIACSQAQVQSPVKRARIKKEINSPLAENNSVLEIPKRTKSKWISKANLENSLRKCSTPEKSFLKPKFETKPIFSTKMKQQTLDQMTKKNVASTTIPKPVDNDEDSLDATFCPELDKQPQIPSKSNKRKEDEIFAFNQVKNAQKTALKIEPCSSKPKAKPILAESKFKTKSPDKSLPNVENSSCFFMTTEADKVIIIDESQSGDEENFSSKSDGVLTKAEKACLMEYEKDEYKSDERTNCSDCAQYMKYIRGEIKDNKPVDQCSKHPNNLDTPEDYWDPFFPPTIDVHRNTLVDNRFLGTKK